MSLRATCLLVCSASASPAQHSRHGASPAALLLALTAALACSARLASAEPTEDEDSDAFYMPDAQMSDTAYATFDWSRTKSDFDNMKPPCNALQRSQIAIDELAPNFSSDAVVDGEIDECAPSHCGCDDGTQSNLLHAARCIWASCLQHQIAHHRSKDRCSYMAWTVLLLLYARLSHPRCLLLRCRAGCDHQCDAGSRRRTTRASGSCSFSTLRVRHLPTKHRPYITSSNRLHSRCRSRRVAEAWHIKRLQCIACTCKEPLSRIVQLCCMPCCAAHHGSQHTHVVRLTSLLQQSNTMQFAADFTFVCPTEIIAFSDRVKEFTDRNAAVIGASCDSAEVWLLRFALLQH